MSRSRKPQTVRGPSGRGKAKKAGTGAGESLSKPISIRMNTTLLEALKRYCVAHRLTMTSVIEQVLLDFLKAEKRKGRLPSPGAEIEGDFSKLRIRREVGELQE